MNVIISANLLIMVLRERSENLLRLVFGDVQGTFIELVARGYDTVSNE